MDEVVEILKEDGSKTKNYIIKSVAHKKGVCHGIVALGIINDNGQLLLQKRNKNKKSEPSKWDLSSAGHIGIKEELEDAVIRETKEELGIDLNYDEIKLIDTYLNKIKLEDEYINHYTYLYILKKNIDINDIVIDNKEVCEIKFVSKNEFLSLLESDLMVNAARYCKKILNYIK